MPRLTVYHGRVVCWIVGDGEIEVINCYRGPTKYSGRNSSISSSSSSGSSSSSVSGSSRSSRIVYN